MALLRLPYEFSLKYVFGCHITCSRTQVLCNFHVFFLFCSVWFGHRVVESTVLRFCFPLHIIARTAPGGRILIIRVRSIVKVKEPSHVCKAEDSLSSYCGFN